MNRLICCMSPPRAYLRRGVGSSGSPRGEVDAEVDAERGSHRDLHEREPQVDAAQLGAESDGAARRRLPSAIVIGYDHAALDGDVGPLPVVAVSRLSDVERIELIRLVLD